MKQKYKVEWPDNNDRAENDHTYFEYWLEYQWNAGWELVTYTPGGYVFKRIDQPSLEDEAQITKVQPGARRLYPRSPAEE